ncbi:MAG: hypothetical protein Q7U06_00320, partial [Pseudomonadota bacterium]|nr:hypothetical protein [Pseudomonadota bacterium]
MPLAVRSAPAHPLVLGAAALILVNDFVLRGHAPGWLTGKLSDVGWLVVAPVLVAALLSFLGASARVAKAGGLGIAGGFYVALQVWPPLGAWIRPGHVADLGDLLVLPALLGAGLAWRRGSGRGWAPLLAVPALGAVLVADDYGFIQPMSVPCGNGMAWDPSDPLRVVLSAMYIPWDTDGFVRGLRLTDEHGTDIPLVVTGSWSGGTVCARDGLRGDTGYTWEIGPWDERSSNELSFAHKALRTVRFRTLPGDGPPAADAAACAALVAIVDEALTDRCQGGDTG